MPTAFECFHEEETRQREKTDWSMVTMEEEEKPKGVVVGGSVAGLSCAHALISAGWRVVVLEKTPDPPSGSPTGAGLGLDPQSLSFLSSWLPRPELLRESTLPLAVDLNRVTDSGKKTCRTLVRDDDFGFQAAHWTDLHGLLFRALLPHVLLWGHQFLSFQTSHDKSFVKVDAKNVKTDEIVTITGHLLVAADGCLSSIRQHFLPNVKLGYSGYCAWRGIIDFSENKDSQTLSNLYKAYPDLGNSLYFDLASGTHAALYELLNRRINWIWYVNQPEPKLKGTSVTMKVNSEMIKKMHEEAEKVWIPELASVMKETKHPFINVIYDCDILPTLYWENVVLIGDAAHPTSPHGLRSTNMSILDAGILGQCLQKWSINKLDSALKEFESIRLPVISQQVLHSRKLGRMKQGLELDGGEKFDPFTASEEECKKLQQRNMPFFAQVPSLRGSSL